MSLARSYVCFSIFCVFAKMTAAKIKPLHFKCVLFSGCNDQTLLIGSYPSVNCTDLYGTKVMSETFSRSLRSVKCCRRRKVVGPLLNERTKLQKTCSLIAHNHWSIRLVSHTAVSRRMASVEKCLAVKTRKAEPTSHLAGFIFKVVIFPSHHGRFIMRCASIH